MAIASRRQPERAGAESLWLPLAPVLLLVVFCAAPADAQSLLAGQDLSASNGPSYFAGPSVPAKPLPASEPEAYISLWKPLTPQKEFAPYVPITRRQRLRWFLTYTFAPSHFAGGLVVAGVTTAIDRPPEYGTHWGGFGERYGLRMTGIVPQNAMEAALGLAIGEDPRYFSARGLPFRARVGNVVRLTFEARRTDGTYGVAYARFSAITGSNLLSNSWRPRSEDNAQGVLIRTGAGFAGRMAVNAFEEFWPSIRDHFFK